MIDRPCAIMRVEKLKNGGAITGSEHHSQRSRNTPNADIRKTGDNLRFIGGLDVSLEELIQERIGNNGGKKIRQSADPKQQPVLALEMILTASPEYFRPNSPGEAGVYNPDLLENWLALNKQWLEETFGDKAVRAELHLDEATPHIHAYIVPIDPKGHLSARHFVGGKKKLSKLQTDYADAMTPLGLERGIKGSRAKHEKIKDYYKRVEKDASPSLSRADLERHSADRQTQIERRKSAEATSRMLVDKVSNLEKTIKLKDKQIDGYKKAITPRQQLRDIPLPDVARALGLQPNEVAKNRWQNQQHNIKITGSKFYDFRTAQGGGGAIDLVMVVRGANFKDAIQWLDDELGVGAGRAIANAEIDEAEDAPREFINIPRPVLGAWEGVRSRLLTSTELPANLIDRLYEEGVVYASSDDKAVFIERDSEGQHTGAILMDSTGGYSRCTGGDQGAFYVGKLTAKTVVIVDTPIDAMAQSILDGPRGKQNKYVSQGGRRAHIEHCKNADKVSVAMKRGDRIEEVYRRLKRDRPNAKKYYQEKSPKQLLKAKMKKLRREIGSYADAMEQQEDNGM